MIKFDFNLHNYTEHKVSKNIKRIEVIDRKKLQDGIDTFQKELDWQQMWSVDDAEKRLKDNRWFYIIEKNDKYIGWAWIDTPNKQFCNLCFFLSILLMLLWLIDQNLSHFRN